MSVLATQIRLLRRAFAHYTATASRALEKFCSDDERPDEGDNILDAQDNLERIAAELCRACKSKGIPCPAIQKIAAAPMWAAIKERACAKALAVDFYTILAHEVDAIESAADKPAQSPSGGHHKKRKVTGKRLRDKPLTDPMKEAAEMLAACKGSKTEAANRLGISRAALDDRLEGVKLRGDLSKSKSVATASLLHDHAGIYNPKRRNHRPKKRGAQV